MSEEQPKPKTIDERLDALAVSLELLTVNMHSMQDRQREADERQRRGINAILAAIEAYLKELRNGSDA